MWETVKTIILEHGKEAKIEDVLKIIPDDSKDFFLSILQRFLPTKEENKGESET